LAFRLLQRIILAYAGVFARRLERPILSHGQ
jgi:hypothetical protein